MATNFPIKCDRCPEFMYLRWEVGRNQSYECPYCSDRWAIVRINSSGGINSVSFTNRKDAAGNHQAVAIGRGLGALFNGLLRRKKG